MYRNPILYADYSDPDVIRVGDDYYMVASSFTYLPGVPILHSKDMVHWEIINYCVRSLPFARYHVPAHGCGTWAPSIRYHDGMFYVFIPLPDEGIFVAKSPDIQGTFSLACLTEAKGWIDPCPFWDEDGRAYMVFAYAKSRCGFQHRLSIVEIDPACTHLLGEPRLVFHDESLAPTIEGPKLYRYNGYYWIFAPAGGVPQGWQCALRSKSIFGPYEYRKVMEQGNTPVNGPHQGGWVTAQDGKHWFLHFQDVGALGRITHLQPMVFRDGWPVIGSDQGEPVRTAPLPVAGMPKYRIATSDDFSGEELGIQWQWQANPRQEFYEMAKPGLRLFCWANPNRENLLWYAPNALTQIPQSSAFTVETRVTLFGEQSGDLASLGMLGHEYAYCCLEKTAAGNRVRLYTGTVTQPQGEGLAEKALQEDAEIKGSVLWLRLKVENGGYRFSWSENGEQYRRVGGSYPLSAATWTGMKLCLWCANRENRQSGGFGQYTYIKVEATT